MIPNSRRRHWQRLADGGNFGLKGDAINDVGQVIGNQQATIWMEQQIGRPAPGLIVLQPSFYEGLCPQVIGLAPGNRDAVAGVSRVRCAVPATMLGNEELVLIRGG